MKNRLRSRRFNILLAAMLTSVALLITPAVLYAADTLAGTEGNSGESAIPAVTGNTPTQFSNPSPAIGTNDPLAPISIDYSDADGINSTMVEFYFDGEWLTCKNYVPGIVITSRGLVWNHETATSTDPNDPCKIWESAIIPMTDGTHTVRVEVTDLLDELSVYEWSFTMDHEPPVVTPPSVCGQLYETDSVDINYSYSDAVTGIDAASVAMYLDGSQVPATADASSAQYAATGLEDGWHTTELSVSDAAGNQYSEGCGFTVDTQAPTIDAVSPVESARVVAASPLIQVNWSDAGAGIDQYSAQVKLDGVDVTADASAATYGLSYQASNLDLGDHTVWVSVADTTGKATTYEWTFTHAETISYYAPWYDSLPQNNMRGNWILVSNQENTDAAVAIYVGGQPMINPDYKPDLANSAAAAAFGGAGGDQYGGAAGDQYTFIVPAHDRITPQFPDTIDGPVRVVSLDAKELLVSQRVLYGDSFNEVMAVRETDLDNDYYFTWYDSLPRNNMKGNWVLVGNVSDSAAAEVSISINGQPMANPNWQQDGAPDQYTYVVDPGGIITPSFPNTIGGPVRVTCNNCAPDHDLIVSQRVIYNDSFTEVMGIPEQQLGSEYYFTWYDSLPQNDMKGNWVLVGNTGSNAAADVYIEIAGKRRLNPLPGAPGNEHFYVPAGSSIAPQFPGVKDGPVRVVCNNCSGDMKIYASQRVIFRNSFEEVQGTSPAQMGDSAVFTWYDMQSEGMNGNWILVGNDSSAAVHVYISIGGQNATGPDPLDVAPFGNRTPSFAGVMGGPVNVVCENCVYGQKLIVSQRVIYKDSFNEVVGRPPVS